MGQELPLAVVGLGCRFPGAPDIDTYWSNILADVYSIGPLPPERFHKERYFDPEIGAYGKSYCQVGGVIPDHEPPRGEWVRRIPPSVVASADRAHLWALDVAEATFKDAGLEPDALRGKNVGVILGHARGSMQTSDLAFATAIEGMLPALDELGALDAARPAIRSRVVEAIHRRYPSPTEDGSLATSASALAGRIATTFGLTGRHMVVDAACASSFAALEVAARALRRGALDLALCGGASYSQELSVILFAQSRALSADGSFPFDRRANGFISSDGVGFFLLARLDDAIRAGAPIRAVIHGVGGSCDGKGKALWAPRKEGQLVAIARAYQASKIDPATVQIIEGHATSTPIGDATEIAALHDHFAPHLTKGRRLPIGSVKGNIGHCREAAGAAGLIKTILALQHGTLPPTGNFRQPAESVPWGEVALEVATHAAPWPSNGSSPRRAGIDAFGIGGLNYHVIVEEAPPAHTRARSTPAPALAEIPSRKKRPMKMAVLGMGARVPEASTLDQLWSHLVEGKDVLVEIPPERWSKAIYHRPGEAAPFRSYSQKGAFVRGFNPDWRRYKVPPKLVEQNDPLQFMLLESAIDALEDAGIDLASIDRTRVAVVMGTVYGSDYALELSLSIRAAELAEALAKESGDLSAIPALTAALRKGHPTINEDSSGSFSSSTLASRIAKTLDLMGPTFTLDAACASSLAAFETAADLLESGEIDLVIVGGGDRAMRVQRYAAYCQLGALSRSGEARPFDAAADGFLPGEGAAVCVMRRLDDAVAAKEPVRAVLHGIGSASDGAVPGGPGGLYRPAAEGLALAMQRAFEEAALTPDAVGVIETHGLGTPASDAAEVEAIHKVYAPSERKTPLLLGSTKSHLGHTQGAAGAVALIKSVLALEHGQLPPTRGFASAPPAYRFEPGLRINGKAEPHPAGAVAISSFGVGGLDYHLLLSGPPEGAARKRSGASDALDPGAWVRELRAPTLEALSRIVKDLSPDALLDGAPSGDGQAVLTLVAADRAELVERLATLRKTGLVPSARALLMKQGIFFRAGPPRAPEKVAFLFSGQGSQYGGMMRAIHDAVPAAREVMARIDRWLSGRGQPPLSARIFDGAPIAEQVFLVQASLLAADLMAFEAVRARISPAVVTGHSFGDYAALVAAGAWSLEDALLATWLRSEAIESTVEPGGMISCVAPLPAVEAALLSLPAGTQVWPSNLNAPLQTVISGTPAGLDLAATALSAAKIEHRRVAVPRAFHSPLMAAARAKLEDALRSVPITTPALPFLSSTSGRYESDPEEIRRSLIAQLTERVHFIAQIEKLIADGTTVFIECGPRGVLSGLAAQIAEAAGAEVEVLASDDATRPGRWAMARLMAMLRARQPGDRAESSAPDSKLVVLDGAEAEAMLSNPGFFDFWGRNQRAVAELVKGLWAAESVRLSSIPPPPLPVPEAVSETPALIAPSADGRAEIRGFLIEAIAAQTGYPPDIIDLGADLEGDLGIDTVKQAQVLGKVRDRFSLRTEEKLSLADFPTLNHILAYVERQLASRAPETKPRRKIPTVDVTARRGTSKKPAPVVAVPSPISRAAEPSAETRVLELRGTAREIGQQHGEALRPAIREVIARYQAFLGERGLDSAGVPEATRSLSTLFDEASLEEIRGIADGVGLPYAVLLAYNLDAALFPAWVPGCTQALRTASANGGTLLHLANEDSPLLLHLEGKTARTVQLRLRTDGPHPERTTVLFSLAGQVSGPNGANAAGLTVTSCTLLDAKTPEGIPNGMPHPMLVKRIVEEADSLESARAVIGAARRAGRWSLLISEADRDRAAYLEYDGGAILNEAAVERELVTSNHSLAGPAPGSSVPEHSIHRGRRASMMIEASAPLTVEGAQAVLRDRFDLARGRVVAHPTMNTVRRADNVMSLVVEPKARRLHVTDRVERPGQEASRFLTIAYGEAKAPAIHAARALSSQGAGLVEVPEVMRRHVVRAITEKAPPPVAQFAPGPTLLVGTVERTGAIAEQLTARGASVTRAPDPRAALELLDRGERFDTLGLVLDPPSGAEWSTRREQAIEAPFALLQSFCAGPASPRCLFAVTVMGGALGFMNLVQGAPEHGAVAGLLKAIRRELGSERFQVQLLDTSPSSTAAQIAGALLAELDAGLPRLEVGLLRNKRVRLAMAPTPAAHASTPPAALPATWIVTGGARGITAQVARRLAALYQPVLHLIGRHPLPSEEERARWRSVAAAGGTAVRDRVIVELRAAPAGLSPRDLSDRLGAIEKTLEIDSNLRAIAAAGSVVRYHALDLSDRGAVAAVLDAIRAEGRPIEGLIHGAGVEIAKALDKKTAPIVEATLGGKLDGLVHLLALTEPDPLQAVLAFSSVSGRFGGHGQADYAMANEAMARVLGAHRARHPKLRAAALCWPAWSEVGLAARSSAKTFLEQSGQRFMSPEEGANHLIRELWAGLPEAEVVFADHLEALDLDRLLVPAGGDFDRVASQLAGSPLLSRLVLLAPDGSRAIAERKVSAAEPFLDQHRMGATPILPAVIGLEVMSELLAAEGGGAALAEVQIHQPMKVPEGAEVLLRADREGDRLQLTATAIKPDGVVLEPDRVYFSARRVPKNGLPEARLREAFSGEAIPYPYPPQIDRTPGSRMIYHGPAFQCLRGVQPSEGGGRALLSVPPVEALVPGAKPTAFLIPAALLDGCLQAAGVLGRMVHGLSALPIGFGRVEVASRAVSATGRSVTLEIRQRKEGESQLVSDLFAFDEEGPLLIVEAYRAQVVRGL